MPLCDHVRVRVRVGVGLGAVAGAGAGAAAPDGATGSPGGPNGGIQGKRKSSLMNLFSKISNSVRPVRRGSGDGSGEGCGVMKGKRCVCV